MDGSVAGPVAIALSGVVVGAVLGFVGTLLEGRLRRRRRGRTAARLIWLELMSSRTIVSRAREEATRPHLRAPFPSAAWEAERAAFAEVADHRALTLVSLAHTRLAWAYEGLTSSELAAIPELPSETRREAWEPFLKGLFEAVEEALAQLDRYSGLTRGPVDYSQLKGREA